jgi:ferritin-like protein
VKLTRRAALVGAPLVLAAPALATGGDAEMLSECLRVEQLALFAYAAASTSGAAGFAQSFYEHETAHAKAIAKYIEALGAPKPPAIADAAAADAEARRLHIEPVLSQLQNPRDVVRFLLTVEERLIGVWVKAHAKLLDQRLLQTATMILGCQAQHAVVLRRTLHEEEVPHAVDAGEYPG